MQLNCEEIIRLSSSKKIYRSILAIESFSSSIDFGHRVFLHRSILAIESFSSSIDFGHRVFFFIDRFWTSSLFLHRSILAIESFLALIDFGYRGFFFIDRFWPSNFHRSILVIVFFFIDRICSSTTFIDRFCSSTRSLDRTTPDTHVHVENLPGSMPTGTGVGNRTLWHSGNLCLVSWSPFSTLQQIQEF